MNAFRPSEHPPVRGGNMSKRLGEVIGCKDKTSLWHSIGYLDGSNIGSTVSWGEIHHHIVHFHESPCRDTKQNKDKGQDEHANSSILLHWV